MTEQNKEWFSEGKDGFSTKKSMDKAASMRKERGVPRFWLKDGNNATIVFLDESPFFVWEHNLNIGGKWGNFVTCTKDMGDRECPICADGNKSVYTAYLSCIDTTEFTRKDNTKVSNRRVLYPAKGSTILKIEDLVKDGVTLVNHAFKIKRYQPSDPNCGTDFTQIGKEVDMSQFPKETIEVIDYLKVLKPYTDTELSELGFTPATVVGSKEDTGLNTTEESDLDVEDLS